MRSEINSAANFLTNLLRVSTAKEGTNHQILDQFRCRLVCMLCQHYQRHWFPDSPCKGSGYRCIRINHKMDPIVARAGAECGFEPSRLRELFPSELTLWIDPCEVAYRIGEDGSICVLYDGKEPRTPKRSAPIDMPLSSDEGSCSPMSISPPSPRVSCKESFRESILIMDPHNSFEMVAS